MDYRLWTITYVSFRKFIVHSPCLAGRQAWSIVLFFLLGCGSSSSDLPLSPSPSASLVTKTVSLEPAWPENLASRSNTLELHAWLKSDDNQGKAAGQLGPVLATVDGNTYQFTFSDISSELSPQADVTIDILWSDENLSEACRTIAKISKNILFAEGKVTLQTLPQDFDTNQDCDQDGITNLNELLGGTKADVADSDGDGVKDGADLFPFDLQESADSDQDSRGDNNDNCPFFANPLQEDWDEDRVGDACDSDWDTDGDTVLDAVDNCLIIANEDQTDFDRDGIGDVCDSDMDGDGVTNDGDNCVDTINPDQANSDSDPLGDACDCDPTNPLRYQTAADDPDTNHFDSNCDGIDGDETKAVFLSQFRGNDAGNGGLTEPVLTLGNALVLALSAPKDIYIENGSYDLTGVSFANGVRLFGGYQNNFTSRSGETVLSSLVFDHATGEFLLDGFHMQEVTIRSSAVTLQNNLIDGGTGANDSFGVRIDDADAVILRNNTIRAGAGRVAVGVEVEGSSPTIEYNTIDATSRFAPAGGTSTTATVTAVSFENALGLKLNNNILITGNAANQYVLYCRGLEPQAGGITANVLTVSPLAGYFADIIPRSVSCLGEFDFAAADGLDLGLGQAQGNQDGTTP